MEFRWWVAGGRQFCCSESEDEAGTNVTSRWYQMGSFWIQIDFKLMLVRSSIFFVSFFWSSVVR